MKTGIELIAEERLRQVTEEGWTEEHDDKHITGDLALAAAAYAQYSATTSYLGPNCCRSLNPPRDWPWFKSQWKPTQDYRCLVKAGALIAAEIDRLQRLTHE